MIDLLIAQRWDVPSNTTPGLVYIVRRTPGQGPEDDLWTCTCNGFRFGSRRHSQFRCTHIKATQYDLIESFTSQLLGVETPLTALRERQP